MKLKCISIQQRQRHSNVTMWVKSKGNAGHGQLDAVTASGAQPVQGQALNIEPRGVALWNTLLPCAVQSQSICALDCPRFSALLACKACWSGNSSSNLSHCVLIRHSAPTVICMCCRRRVPGSARDQAEAWSACLTFKHLFFNCPPGHLCKEA